MKAGVALASIAVLTILLKTEVVTGFHTPVEKIISTPHCWPLDADENNDETIDCGNLTFQWLTLPGSVEVEQGEPIEFAVIINATSDAQLGRMEELCEEECPSDCNVTAEDCCIWHADVHICYPNTSSDIPPPCTPWNQENLILTEKTCGPFGVYNVTLMLYNPGVTTVMYNMKIGNISIALADYIVVVETVCGDTVCQTIEECECPKDKPSIECRNCPEDCCPIFLLIFLLTFIFIFIVLPISIVFAIILAVVVVLYRRKRKKMKDESWIVNYNDIMTNPGKKAMSSMVSLSRKRDHHLPGSAYPSSLNLQAQQIFTEMGSYKGLRVAIRRIRINKSLFGGCGLLISDIRKEVLKIRYLEHQNLCKFIGATIKDPHPNTVIISEYCAKGSLNDVLLNDAVPLTWNFRFSFAADIARGMAYLHSHGITHGRLTSSNCVIDDRWVTKVTDYGLGCLRCYRANEEEQEEEAENLQGTIPKVYRAPEVRNLQPQTSSDSEPADVYSYAIILYEIATGMDPRSEGTWSLDANWKPKIIQSDLTITECPCSQSYLNLINKCWTYSPQTRPPFDRIRKELRDINPSHTSAIDNMMLMMEKYSQNLEELVRERTDELEQEKVKTQNLLYRMIPEAVANELKYGHDVEAEEFEGATIFFSDIVGFTNLASSSAPKQIVALLNKLYTEFDQVLDQFDVYKVETIGDAYMVVSGVPAANGDRHAGEIAKMALKLMAVCETFVIPHQPETKFQIRAGIHSGSVCAGIVGKKMPRYCLFGDTVNTASRMESNSIAMHIQCSDSTYQLLETLGGFILEDRGEIPIKGKGTMNTWWLKGYKEPEIQLLLPPPPPPPPASSLPSPNDDEPHSPIIKEPIRDAPKKLSSVEKTPSELKSSTKSLSRGPSSTALDLYKRHQSLTSNSFVNLRSVDERDKKGRERAAKTMPRELESSGSAIELSQSMDSKPSRQPKRSVPLISVTSHSPLMASRRVTEPIIQTVGLMGSSNRINGTERKVSSTSITSREKVVVAPLESITDTQL